MDSTPKYEVVKKAILDKIKNKELNVGDKLPSESELRETFDVSRHTIRTALSQLEYEGTIAKEQGLGSFVTGTQKKSFKTVGVITTYLSEYIFPTIIRGIESEMSSLGYSIILASTNNDISIEAQALEMMMSRKVDGIIVEPTKSSTYNENLGQYLRIKELGIPLLMINTHYEELETPYIGLNDVELGYTAAKHLIENNHVAIGGIFKSDDRQGKDRLKGFIKAFSENAIEFNKDLVIMYDTENYQEMIEKQLPKLLKRLEFTGLVCYNDNVAIDVLNQAWTLGYKVPEDFSIVSHDNSILSTMTETKISSINHPKTKLGKDAAKAMVEMIESGNHDIESIIYPTVLVEKSSVKKLD